MKEKEKIELLTQTEKFVGKGKIRYKKKTKINQNQKVFCLGTRSKKRLDLINLNGNALPLHKGQNSSPGKGQASSPPQRASLFAAGKGTPLSVIRANIHAYPITIFQCFHPSRKSLTFSCSSFPKKQTLIWYTLQKIP